MSTVRIVAISDTHMYHEDMQIPEGDILVHCGDMTNNGTVSEVAAFGIWFRWQLHPIKLYIPGNHDFLFERDVHTARNLMGCEEDGIYDLTQTVRRFLGLDFYGSPWVREYGNWAFMPSDDELERRASQIPQVDVLVTHGPAYGHLDTPLSKGRSGHFQSHAGDPWITGAIIKRPPRLHLSGHIHEGYGVDGIHHNCAIYNHRDKTLNAPHVIDLEVP